MEGFWVISLDGSKVGTVGGAKEFSFIVGAVVAEGLGMTDTDTAEKLGAAETNHNGAILGFENDGRLFDNSFGP